MTSLQGNVAITARANRPGGQNSLLYSGRETAAQQTQAYPDIADGRGRPRTTRTFGSRRQCGAHPGICCCVSVASLRPCTGTDLQRLAQQPVDKRLHIGASGRVVVFDQFEVRPHRNFQVKWRDKAPIL